MCIYICMPVHHVCEGRGQMIILGPMRLELKMAVDAG